MGNTCSDASGDHERTSNERTIEMSQARAAGPDRAKEPTLRFVMLELPRAMRTRLLWCITLFLLCHPRVWAQTVTTQFPPGTPASPGSAAASASSVNTADLPDDPSLQSTLPEAHVVPQPPPGVR